MSVGEKKEWYRAEKLKRQQESKSSKRSLSDYKAFCSSEDQQGTLEDECDVYQTFEEWAKDEILLGRAKNIEDAEPKWIRKLMEPGAPVKEVRGAQLLGKFVGVHANKRKSSMLTTGMKGSCSVDSQESLDEVRTTMEKHQAKFACCG